MTSKKYKKRIRAFKGTTTGIYIVDTRCGACNFYPGDVVKTELKNTLMVVGVGTNEEDFSFEQRLVVTSPNGVYCYGEDDVRCIAKWKLLERFGNIKEMKQVELKEITREQVKIYLDHTASFTEQGKAIQVGNTSIRMWKYQKQ